MIKLVLAIVLVAGCGDADEGGHVMTGGDPARGRAALRHHGCIACHAIPGAGGMSPRVAPPLDDLASRTYLAGHLPNTPANLIRWIRFPQEVLPGNAMPDMGIGADDARDIAAYLYTLRSR